MKQRILPELSTFINSANTQQPWFTGSRKKAGTEWLRYSLNEGIVNSFKLKSGSKTCMSAELPFGDEYRVQHVGTGAELTSAMESSTERTFWSCAFYPNFTRDYRDFLMIPEDHTFVTDLDVDTSLEASSNITVFLSTCLMEYCNNPEGCRTRTSSCSPQQLVVNESLLSASAVQSCLSDICKYDRWYSDSVNSDIMGIGVTISYSLQLGIASMSVLIFIWQRSRKGKQGSTREGKTQRCIREAVFIALDDFQRAQCCFVITVSIATLGVLGGMSITERRTVGAVTSSGSTPTVAVLMTLMLSDHARYSDLTFYLTFYTWVFALAINFSPSITSAQLQPQQPNAYGQWPPTRICNFESSQDNLYGAVAAIPVPAMLLLTCLHFYKYDTVKKHFGNKIKAWQVTIGRTAIEVTTIGAMVFAIWTNSEFWTTTTQMDWSFGQIIALSVWLSTVLSFCNDCINGPLIGRTNQLPLPLEVMRLDKIDGKSTNASSLRARHDLEASGTVGCQSCFQNSQYSLTAVLSTISFQSTEHTIGNSVQ